MARSSGVDNDAAHELELYIDNDSVLYRQKDAFLANIHRKMKAGKYKPTEAAKLWMYYVDRGAKQYAKEFGTASEWNRMFNRATRVHLAERYAREEHAMIQRGEYSKYPPVHGTPRSPSSRDARSQEFRCGTSGCRNFNRIQRSKLAHPTCSGCGRHMYKVRRARRR